jgi:septum site-determining protein MinD
VISVYSYRGGTGKTSCIANLAAIVARCGYRVCVVDANLQTPGIHILLGLNECALKRSLHDYLWSRCSVKDAVYDVTTVLQEQCRDRSKFYLIPASPKLGDTARILREGYDIRLLQQGLHRLVAELQLDYLFIDTHSGLSEETLLAIDASDVLLFILSPDQQDFQGIEAALTVSRKFAVPKLLAILNKTPKGLDVDQLLSQIQSTYSLAIAEVLPHAEKLLALGSRGLFTVIHPTDSFSQQLEAIARQIIDEP